MVKCTRFVVDVDRGQKMVSINLKFHTRSLKDLSEAIETLETARKKLMELQNAEEELDSIGDLFSP